MSMHDAHFYGAGWTFPPAFDNSSCQLQLSAGESNIRQSIDLLLHSPRGSRSLMPNFGSGLNQYVFRNVDASVQTEIIQSVKQTLLDSEPRIRVDNVELDVQQGESELRLHIAYTVKQTNTRHNHVFPFSLNEGTNLGVGL